MESREGGGLDDGGAGAGAGADAARSDGDGQPDGGDE